MIIRWKPEKFSSMMPNYFIGVDMQIEIAGNTYEIEDVLSNITIVDRAVVGKLKIVTAYERKKIFM